MQPVAFFPPAGLLLLIVGACFLLSGILGQRKRCHIFMAGSFFVTSGAYKNSKIENHAHFVLGDILAKQKTAIVWIRTGRSERWQGGTRITNFCAIYLRHAAAVSETLKENFDTIYAQLSNWSQAYEDGDTLRIHFDHSTEPIVRSRLRNQLLQRLWQNAQPSLETRVNPHRASFVEIFKTEEHEMDSKFTKGCPEVLWGLQSSEGYQLISGVYKTSKNYLVMHAREKGAKILGCRKSSRRFGAQIIFSSTKTDQFTT